MNPLDKIANEVVIESPKLSSAATKYVFDVDGADFPWYIDERGPRVAQVADDLFVVDVQILLVDKETMGYLPFTYEIPEHRGAPYIPLIDGKSFPWLCTDDDMILLFSHKNVPTLSLKFFAHKVTGSLWVDDQREVFSAGGGLIARNKRKVLGQ